MPGPTVRTEMRDTQDMGPPNRRLVSRRQVLRAGGVLVTAGLVERTFHLPALMAQVGGGPPAPTAVFDLVRSDLQMRFTLELYGLDVVDNQLVDAGPGRSRIVFVIGSQHIDDAIPRTYFAAPVRFRSAQPTRLAFDVTPPIPFDLDTLLDWQDLVLSLDGRAATDEASATQPNTGAPHGDVTTIELLEGLALSPIPTAGPLGGAHPKVRLDADPQTFGGTNVSWQATVIGGATAVPKPPTLRAIWSPGYVTGGTPQSVNEPYDRPLSALDRRSLVQATGDWSDTALSTYPGHEPIAAASLITLSPVGATASLSGSWTGGGPLASWVQEVNLGRTVSAAVVTTGYLLPFGHLASVTRTIARRFTVALDGNVVAGLFEVETLVIPPSTVTTDPEVMFSDGREWPLRTVSVTPPAAVPQGRGDVGVSTDEAFLLQNDDGTPHELWFEATDRLGRTGITFRCPVVFVEANAAFEPQDNPMATVVAWFGRPERDDLFTIDFGGQPIGMADAPAPGEEAAVTLLVESIRMDLQPPSVDVTPDDLRARGQVGGLPRMVRAVVSDPVIDGLRGVSEPLLVHPSPDWLEHGYGPDNVGGTFLVMDQRVALGYSGAGGGLAAPELVVDEFNIDLGISASLDDLTGGWNPLENLQLTAELFGAVPLQWILPDTIDFGTDLGSQTDLPAIRVELDGNVPPTSATFAFCWEPPLRSLDVGGSPTFVTTDDLPQGDLINPFDDDTIASFKVSETVVFDDSPTEGAALEIVIENVLLQLPPVVPLVQLYVRRVALVIDANEGESLDVDIIEVRFTGVLNFLDVIERYLGGVLDVVPGSSGSLLVSGSVSVTDLDLGLVEIGPLRITSRLTLPAGDDDGHTEVDVAMEEFGFTFLGFGGSGQFRVLAAPHPLGVIELVAELAGVIEVGISALIVDAKVQLSFGARLELTTRREVNGRTGQVDEFQEREITVFVAISAGLNVLGIVQLSGSLELAAIYNLDTRVFSGEVTGTYSVEYPWGETTKSATFRESFRVGELGAGGNGGNAARSLAGTRAVSAGSVTFADRYSESEWLEYCGKFV